VIKFVPQQEAWIVERMGRFHRILDPGLAILIPVLDKIQYVQTLKEVAIDIPTQSAITQGEWIHFLMSRQCYSSN
jgi:regulator of protease activity HflC (stomatin/prohibitin superfamily)